MIGVFLLETAADYLNFTRLSDPLPDEFKDSIDSEKYQLSLEYQKERTKFEITQRLILLTLTLSFILGGGLNSLDLFIRKFQLNSILTGVIFIGSLTLLSLIIQLPFSWYETFTIEEKYGFNKITPSLFFQDRIKEILIGICIGGPILFGILYFFNHTGSHAWLYCWLALSVFQILLIYLGPALLMPLFNRFEPLQEGSLKQSIELYVKTRNFKLSGIYTMDGSKRSTKSNAFFTGFGKFRRLVLFDTLILKNSEAELVSILAHEIGHFEKKHILKTMALSWITTGILFYFLGLFLNHPALFSAFQMSQISTYASIIFISIFFEPILRIFSVGGQMISRIHEFEADAFSVQTYKNPELLISALKKLSLDHLSHLTPHPLKVTLDYSHPPILERIKRIRKHTQSKSL